MSDDNTLVACGWAKKGQLGILRVTEAPFCPLLLPVVVLPKHEKVVQVALGNAHTLVLTEAGRVYSWGKVIHKVPENNENSGVFGPYHVPFSEEATFVCCGWDYCLVVTKSGSLFSWGCADYGALGHPGFSRKIPTRVDIPGEVISVSSGSAHVLAITKKGDLYGWGWNRASQLGIKTDADVEEPKKLDFGIEVDQVTCGLDYTYIISKKGELHGFGSSKLGELGIVSQKSVPPSTIIPLPNKVIGVASGHNHTIALCEDGTVWTWGDTNCEEEGEGEREDREGPVEVKITLEGMKKVKEGKEGKEEREEESKAETGGQRQDGGRPEVVSVMCSLRESFVGFSDGNIFVWGLANDKFGLSKEKKYPQKIPGKFSVPKKFQMKKFFDGIMMWLFLGKADGSSSFFGLPWKFCSMSANFWNQFKLFQK